MRPAQVTFMHFTCNDRSFFPAAFADILAAKRATTRKGHHMGSVVVYHFEMKNPKAHEGTRSKRPGTREAIEALGFTPIMETAQVVERTYLDGSGFLRPDLAGESAA